MPAKNVKYLQHDCNYEGFFQRFPRSFEVKEGNHQWWHHEPGCEFLAANPIDIPGLQAIVRQGSCAYLDVDTHFSPHEIETVARPESFRKLSFEIKCMILEHLGPKDIANLRLATPAFRTLPNILFKRLVLEDMPWIWEAESLPTTGSMDGIHLGTDWHKLYSKTKGHWPHLKGMQNRKRIWRDVEEIVMRIKGLREQGIVDPQF